MPFRVPFHCCRYFHFHLCTLLCSLHQGTVRGGHLGRFPQLHTILIANSFFSRCLAQQTLFLVQWYHCGTPLCNPTCVDGMAGVPASAGADRTSPDAVPPKVGAFLCDFANVSLGPSSLGTHRGAEGQSPNAVPPGEAYVRCTAPSDDWRVAAYVGGAFLDGGVRVCPLERLLGESLAVLEGCAPPTCACLQRAHACRCSAREELLRRILVSALLTGAPRPQFVCSSVPCMVASDGDPTAGPSQMRTCTSACTGSARGACGARTLVTFERRGEGVHVEATCNGMAGCACEALCTAALRGADGLGGRLLFAAVSLRSECAVRALRALGAEPSPFGGPLGVAPIHLAAMNGDVGVAGALLCTCSVLSHVASSGECALALAQLGCAPPQLGESDAVAYACACKNSMRGAECACMQQLLATDDAAGGWSAFHYAAAGGHAAVLEVLARSWQVHATTRSVGMDPMAIPDRWGVTPSQYLRRREEGR